MFEMFYETKKWIKQFFCKHEYKYIWSLIGTYYVCEKCKKRVKKRPPTELMASGEKEAN